MAVSPDPFLLSTQLIRKAKVVDRCTETVYNKVTGMMVAGRMGQQNFVWSVTFSWQMIF